MPHVHPTQTTTRRGATSLPAEGAAASASFRNFNATSTGSGSAAVEAAGLGEGFRLARPISAGDFTSAVAAPASVVLPAPGLARSHAIHGVDFGYGTTPIAGAQLTITDGISTHRVPVPAAGPQQLDFAPPMVFAPNAQVSGSLSSGGGSVSGYFGFSGRSIV